MIRAHDAPGGRYLATPRRGWRLCGRFQKKERRGANSVQSKAGVDGRLHVGDPVGQREGDLLHAVEPASRMWYPEMEMVFPDGSSVRQ